MSSIFFAVFYHRYATFKYVVCKRRRNTDNSLHKNTNFHFGYQEREETLCNLFEEKIFIGNTMKEQSEEERNVNENEVKTEEPQGSLLWRISGGVYSKAATVAGGVGWIAGSAISTTCSAVTTVGGYAITPFRKEPKHKSD